MDKLRANRERKMQSAITKVFSNELYNKASPFIYTIGDNYYIRILELKNCGHTWSDSVITILKNKANIPFICKTKFCILSDVNISNNKDRRKYC